MEIKRKSSSQQQYRPGMQQTGQYVYGEWSPKKRNSSSKQQQQPSFQKTSTFTRKKEKKNIITFDDPVMTDVSSFRGNLRQRYHTQIDMYDMLRHFAQQYKDVMCSYIPSISIEYNVDYENVNKRKLMISIPTQFWNELQKCKNEKRRFVVIPLYAINTYHKYGEKRMLGHQNIILIDFKEEWSGRFEPHGISSSTGLGKYMNDKIDELISSFLIMSKENMKNNYFGDYDPSKYTNEKCSNRGAQAYENAFELAFTERENTELFEETDGFCKIWCLLFVELRLRNPEKSTHEIIEYMCTPAAHTIRSLPAYIRYYVDNLLELHNYFSRKKIQNSNKQNSNKQNGKKFPKYTKNTFVVLGTGVMLIDKVNWNDKTKMYEYDTIWKKKNDKNVSIPGARTRFSENEISREITKDLPGVLCTQRNFPRKQKSQQSKSYQSIEPLVFEDRSQQLLTPEKFGKLKQGPRGICDQSFDITAENLEKLKKNFHDLIYFPENYVPFRKTYYNIFQHQQRSPAHGLKISKQKKQQYLKSKKSSSPGHKKKK